MGHTAGVIQALDDGGIHRRRPDAPAELPDEIASRLSDADDRAKTHAAVAIAAVAAVPRHRPNLHPSSPEAEALRGHLDLGGHMTVEGV